MSNFTLWETLEEWYVLSQKAQHTLSLSSGLSEIGKYWCGWALCILALSLSSAARRSSSYLTLSSWTRQWEFSYLTFSSANNHTMVYMAIS